MTDASRSRWVGRRSKEKSLYLLRHRGEDMEKF